LIQIKYSGGVIQLSSSLIVGTALIALGAPSAQSQAQAPTHAALRTQFAGRFTGDFDQMLARRLIRMIVPYSRTLFFRSKGDIYGIAAEGAQPAVVKSPSPLLRPRR
jgi:hypothetical protein